MKNKFFSFVLGLCAIFAWALPKTTAAYADTTEYTVVYYDTEDNQHSTQTISSGNYITPPVLTVEDGYKVLWYTSNARDTVYDLNTPVSSNLDLYAGKVEINTILLMQRHSTDYSTGENEYEYETYDSVEVIPGSYATVKNGTEVTGYNFSHWSLTPNGTAFNFYNTPINSDIVLYPVYTIKTFTVNFYVEGRLYESKTVNYNSTVTPPNYTSNTHSLTGWIRTGDTNLVDFNNEYITENTSYEAFLEHISCVINVIESPYYILQNTPADIVNAGGTLVIELKLANDFSHHTLTASDLDINGEYSSLEINHNEATDVYTVVIYGITSLDFFVEMKPLPINEYDVTLPEIEGLTYNITTPASDYTLVDNVYTLGVTKRFTFTVTIADGYYAKSVAFGNCTYSSGTYSLDVRADINIVSHCDIVRYHTVKFAGIDNVNITLTDNYLEENSGEYLYENGEIASFTISANSGYFVKSVVGATSLNNVYTALVNSNINITLNVVECNLVTISIPTGVENVLVTNYLARNLNEYTVEEGSDIQISYSLATAYSDSNVTLNSGSFTNTLSGSIFTVYDITEDVTITFENVVLNDCTLTFVNNAMATLSGNTTVSYGANAVVTFALEDAYSNSVVTAANVSVTGIHYNYTVSGNEITINMITGDITVEIIDLEKNQYTLTLQSNVFGTFEAESTTIVHGNNIVLTPSFEVMYDRANLDLANITITGSYINYTVSNNVVTIINAKSDLTVSLADLDINKYLVKMPPVQAGKFSLSTTSKEVEYGGSITFSLTINEAYSYNVDDFTMYSNSSVLTGTNNGLVFTYAINDITEDITLTVSDMIINTYTVDFIDTSVFITDENGNEVHPMLGVAVADHGETVTAIDPTKTGYEFVNWYADEDCNVVFDFTQPITQNIQIFAKYEIRVYEVTFVANGIVVETVVAYSGDDPEEIAPEIPVRVGYTQVAPYWDFAAVGFNAVVFKDATINAVYTINTYSVKFMTPFSQTPLSSQTISHGGDAIAPVNTGVTGYTFAYWDNTYENITGDTVVNAVYEINTYTVTFINGNTGNKVYEAKANYNATIERPDDSSIVKLGFTVYGWYTDAAMTISYNFNSSIKNDFTLYGNIDVTKLTLRFVIDGNVVEQKEIDYDTNYTGLFPEIPEKTGYTIVGWSQSSVEGLVTNLDVFAIYEIKTYTVTFKYSDGTEEKVTVNYGTTITDLPNKGKGFGVKVSADMSKLRDIDSDREVAVTITDLSYLIYIACGVVALGLIVTVIILSLRVKSSGVIMKQTNKEKPAKQEQSEE